MIFGTISAYLRRRIPIFTWLPAYQRTQLRPDLTTADDRRDGDGEALRQRLFQAGLDLGSARGETGHSVTGSTKTSIVPPQARPTSHAISSLMP